MLRFITNRFDLSADEISQMYRSRWEIELFLKQLKQQTTIKKFFSRDEDGLKNQVYLALISQLLTYLVKLETQSVLSSLIIQRYLFASLWEASELWETRIRGKPTETNGNTMNGCLTLVEGIKINCYSQPLLQSGESHLSA